MSNVGRTLCPYLAGNYVLTGPLAVQAAISAWALYPEDVKDHLSKVRSLESVYNTYGGKQNKNTWTAYYNNPDRISYIQRNYFSFINSFWESLSNLTDSELTDWQFINGQWYYYDNGVSVSGWKSIAGKWYHFSQNGIMDIGWIQDKGIWYYMDNSGAMKTGWLHSGTDWYYLTSDGSMATNWQLINGKWEFFSNNGLWQYTWTGK